MCNTLLCPNDYCQHATEQGRHCVTMRAKLSGLEPLLDPCERVTDKILTQNPPLLNKVALIEQPFSRVATISYLEHAGTGSPFLPTTRQAKLVIIANDHTVQSQLFHISF